jgi:hypothetical protein
MPQSNKKGAAAGSSLLDAAAGVPYTEFQFSTRNDFQIGFYRRGNETGAFAVSGRISPARVFFKPEEFPKIKGMIDRALVVLKSK